MKEKIRILVRWGKMLTGKSVFHQKQSEGEFYFIDKVGGYYSDLRHKVTGDVIIDDEQKVPVNTTSKNENVFFPIAIFQYGLGAYDLFLETGDGRFLDKLRYTATWALDNQADDGSWDTFGWFDPDLKYSSMAQAEGASLLCRAFKEWSDDKYLSAAKRAIDFMLVPIDKGGTASYRPTGVITYEENRFRKTILNGMIFSVWGLLDLVLVTKDDTYSDRLTESVDSLCAILPEYDRRYWSNYDLDGNIASAFYHDLHIQQLKVLYKLFNKEEFARFVRIWSGYEKSFTKPKRAFLVKAIQKIRKIDQEVAIIK